MPGKKIIFGSDKSRNQGNTANQTLQLTVKTSTHRIAGKLNIFFIAHRVIFDDNVIKLKTFAGIAFDHLAHFDTTNFTFNISTILQIHKYLLLHKKIKNK